MGNSCAAGDRKSKLKETAVDHPKIALTFSQSPIEHVDILPSSCTVCVDASTQDEPGWMKSGSDRHLSMTIYDILPKGTTRSCAFRARHASRLLQLNSTNDQEKPNAQGDFRPLKRRNAFRYHNGQFGTLPKWCCEVAMQRFQIVQSSDLISSLIQPCSVVCEFEVSLEWASKTVILKEWMMQPHRVESVQILHSPLLYWGTTRSTRNRNLNHFKMCSVQQKLSPNSSNNQSTFKRIRTVEKNLLRECERLRSEVGRLEVLAAIRSSTSRLLAEGNGTELNPKEFFCNGNRPSCDEFEANRSHLKINRELWLSGERVRESAIEEVLEREAGSL
ncbi:hypothetical protein Aperf_G00000100141 [Anoplocephala perfoliata]